MSEARELLERFRDNLRSLEKGAAEQRVFDLAEAMAQSAIALEFALALATKPEPGAVPELPEWIRGPDQHGDYWVCHGAYARRVGPLVTAEEHDRMAEAYRILAARERARRAGS